MAEPRTPENWVQTIAAAIGVEPEDLIVKMGRSGRIVYGETAKEFRNELDANRVQLLESLSDLPVKPDLVAEDYARKNPQIEIKTRTGNRVFRQEFDGAISVNDLPLLLEPEAVQVEAVPVELVPATVTRAIAITETLATLQSASSAAEVPTAVWAAHQNKQQLALVHVERGPLIQVSDGRVTADCTTSDFNRISSLQQLISAETWKSPIESVTALVGVDALQQLKSSFQEYEALNTMMPTEWLPTFSVQDDCMSALDSARTTIQQIPGAVALLAPVEAEFLTCDQAFELGRLAKQLIDPLGTGGDELQQAEIHQYVIEQQGTAITVSRWVGETLEPILAIAADQAPLTARATPADIAAFQSYLDPVQELEIDAIPVLAASGNALAIAREQLHTADTGAHSGGNWLKELMQGAGDRATQALDLTRQVLTSEPALQLNDAIESQIDRGVQGIKSAWESEAVQAAKTQAQETAKQGISKSWEWLKSRPAAIRDQSAAQSAFDLFQRGHNRTQERAYEAQGLRVEQQGAKHFVVSREEQELMRFSYEKSRIPGMPPRLKVQSVADSMTNADYRTLENFRQSATQPTGSVESENKYTAKATSVGDIAASLLDHLGQSAWESANYHISKTDAGVIVEAKDGRGTLYESSGSQILQCQLVPQDFQRFRQVEAKLKQDLGQEIAPSTPQTGDLDR